ncbi:UNVERIFIED_CONTAM: hypothetical protein FKN15_058481 [Acipenser sinensis]
MANGGKAYSGCLSHWCAKASIASGSLAPVMDNGSIPGRQEVNHCSPEPLPNEAHHLQVKPPF